MKFSSEQNKWQQDNNKKLSRQKRTKERSNEKKTTSYKKKIVRRKKIHWSRESTTLIKKSTIQVQINDMTRTHDIATGKTSIEESFAYYKLNSKKKL